jgi:putative sterol carrier protein
MPENVREVFEEIPRQFDAGAWGSQNAVLQFNVTGDDGGTWTVNIKDGGIIVDEAAASTPDMTVTTSTQDLLAVVNGDLNAVSAFMQGRVRIDGDMSLAMKLQNLLSSRS